MSKLHGVCLRQVMCGVSAQAMLLQVLPVNTEESSSFVVADSSNVHLCTADLPPVSLLTLFQRARQKQQAGSPEAGQHPQQQPQPAAEPSMPWLQQLQAAAGSERLATAVPLPRQVLRAPAHRLVHHQRRESAAKEPCRVLICVRTCGTWTAEFGVTIAQATGTCMR